MLLSCLALVDLTVMKYWGQVKQGCLVVLVVCELLFQMGFLFLSGMTMKAE